MTWHYRLRKRVSPHSTYYDVVEVYDDDGKLSWTQNGIDLIADSPADMKSMLTLILADIDRRPILEEDPS